MLCGPMRPTYATDLARGAKARTAAQAILRDARRGPRHGACAPVRRAGRPLSIPDSQESEPSPLRINGVCWRSVSNHVAPQYIRVGVPSRRGGEPDNAPRQKFFPRGKLDLNYT
jgi:hypothetical protein